MNLEFHTDRLLLRPLTTDDVDLVLEIFTDPHIMRYGGGASTADEVIDHMPEVTRRSGSGCIGVWCVTDRTTGEKLGTCALLPMPIEEEDTNWDLLGGEDIPDGDIEIGYFYRQAVWGKGIATEAASGLLKFTFEDSPLDAVYATFDDPNHASRNVLEKIGLEFESTRLAYAEMSDVFCITKEMWKKNQNQP
jgi:[ribosomal protein S5]-alanine N-acetyltransferase